MRMKHCPVMKELCGHSQIIGGKLACILTEGKPVAEIKKCPITTGRKVKTTPPYVEHLGI